MAVVPLRQPRSLVVYYYAPGVDATAKIVNSLPRQAVVYVADKETAAHWREHPAVLADGIAVVDVENMRATTKPVALIDPTLDEVADAMRLCSGSLTVWSLTGSALSKQMSAPCSVVGSDD